MYYTSQYISEPRSPFGQYGKSRRQGNNKIKLNVDFNSVLKMSVRKTKNEQKNEQ